MKSRAKIKENRRLKREQLLDTRDFCGIKDPTPYQAVKNIIKKERAAARITPDATAAI